MCKRGGHILGSAHGHNAAAGASAGTTPTGERTARCRGSRKGYAGTAIERDAAGAAATDARRAAAHRSRSRAALANAQGIGDLCERSRNTLGRIHIQRANARASAGTAPARKSAARCRGGGQRHTGAFDKRCVACAATIDTRWCTAHRTATTPRHTYRQGVVAAGRWGADRGQQIACRIVAVGLRTSIGVSHGREAVQFIVGVSVSIDTDAQAQCQHCEKKTINCIGIH